MTELFVFPGNACILKDKEHEAYVGIAYCFQAQGRPVFATISTKPTKEQPLEYCLCWIIESLVQGMKQKNREPTTPVAYRNDNAAIITGDGKQHAVGVANGNLHYACPEEGHMTVEQLSLALLAKMRCPDRR